MPIMWGIDMSERSAARLKLHCVLSRALEVKGWRPAETAPHDETEIELRIVHVNAAYSDAADDEGWIATCRGRWTDFNGGGFTWHGLCGSVCQWRPLADAAQKGSA